MKNAIQLLRAVGVYESWMKNQPVRPGFAPWKIPLAKRAKACALVSFNVVEDYDDLNRPHAYIMSGVVCSPPKGSGKIHKVEARLYNPFGKVSPTWISCDCGNFRFTFEEFLVPHHSSSMRYVDGPNRNVRNPSRIPGICKHSIRLLTYATRSTKVRKVLFQTPTLKQLGLKKNVMKQRGIPENYPKQGRPVVDRPVLPPKKTRRRKK